MTTQPTLILAQFLLDRIAEDEAVARSAVDVERPGMHWHWVDPDSDEPIEIDPFTDDVVGTPPDGFRAALRTVEEYPTQDVGPLPGFIIGGAEEIPAGAGLHIARHDPAHVLADCEAKRRIVSLFAPTLNDEWAAANGEWDEAAWKGKQALLALALPYADHPDYREEWRP